MSTDRDCENAATTNPRGHVWKKLDDGKVDLLALDYDEPEGFGGHNGPACVQCQYSYCVYCEDAGPAIDCPNDGKPYWDRPATSSGR